MFSIAMTAWAAKFLTSSICLSVNGRTSWRINVDRADELSLLPHRHREAGSGARHSSLTTGFPT